MQPITYKRILEVIRKKEKIKLVKQPIKEAIINEEPDNERDFGLTALTYATYDSVTIDESFEYYHSELTGKASVDLNIIYGTKDAHDSVHILSKPFRENIAKIKRNYDITLMRLNGVYAIANGRHRIVYLKNFYEQNKISCTTQEEIEELKKLVTIPAKVTKRIDDDLINQLINTLNNTYQDIFIQKANYLNDLPELIIIYRRTLYYVRTKDELIDFYNKIINFQSIDKYKILVSDIERYKNVDKIFEILYERLDDQIYQMDYMGIVRYLTNNPIEFDGIMISIEKINLKYLYSKYVEMITAYTLCLARNEELPKDTNFSSAFYATHRKIGKIIMDCLYEHPEYKDLSWDDFYKILHEHPLLKKYDQDYLKDIAIEHGYKMLLRGHFFTKK